MGFASVKVRGFCGLVQDGTNRFSEFCAVLFLWFCEYFVAYVVLAEVGKNQALLLVFDFYAVSRSRFLELFHKTYRRTELFWFADAESTVRSKFTKVANVVHVVSIDGACSALSPSAPSETGWYAQYKTGCEMPN